jgi:ribose 1,5-bisphosphokinase
VSGLGALAYVMGPSGAGKDTLLAGARAVLDPARFAFAHRYISRPPFAGDENFVSLSAAEFAARHEKGLFAFHWRARDVDYGIGAEIEAWRALGLTVVVSGSRADWESGAPVQAGAIPVLVTAAPEILRKRLEARGRDPDIEQRLARAAAFRVADPALVAIDNSGPVEDGIAALVRALNAIRSGSAAAA